VQPLDDRRYLYEHELATIEDEGIISIDTPDGGSAWVVGAGPDGGSSRGPTDVAFSVDVLSEQLAQILHSYAERGEMVVARWPVDLERQPLSIPTTVFVPMAEQPRHLPPGWPAPFSCATAAELFESLTR
jgi:hypothetical protein